MKGIQDFVMPRMHKMPIILSSKLLVYSLAVLHCSTEFGCDSIYSDELFITIRYGSKTKVQISYFLIYLCSFQADCLEHHHALADTEILFLISQHDIYLMQASVVSISAHLDLSSGRVIGFIE